MNTEYTDELDDYIVSLDNLGKNPYEDEEEEIVNGQDDW